MPEKTYLTKQMICPIGLEVEKIHARSNDCILYREEKYKDLDKCPKCEAPRYNVDDGIVANKIVHGFFIQCESILLIVIYLLHSRM